MIRTVLACVVALALFAAVAEAGTARYDRRRAGHPLRIVAYALHPAGVVLDRLIFEPVWRIGQHEPFRTLCGVVTTGEEEVGPAPAPMPIEPTP